MNATGVFADSVRQMDDSRAEEIVTPSQGIHIVLDRSFLPGDAALMMPRTNDGRGLFAIPWHNRILLGTTDSPVEKPSHEPKPLRSEIEFLLSHAAQYFIARARAVRYSQHLRRVAATA